jgi:hypothetical protein
MTANKAKTTIFNLIILDESGSMSDARKATIAGCNETINVAKAATAANPDAFHSLMSIYAFQSGGPVASRYLLKNENTSNARHITEKDYEPYGATPLLDAIGDTLSELKTASETHEDATGVITIITDGFENDSHRYNWTQVAKMIAGLKEMGWTINLIGANIDLDTMGNALNIDNRMSFQNSNEGTKEMFDKFQDCVANSYCGYAAINEDTDDIQTRRERRKEAAKKFTF